MDEGRALPLLPLYQRADVYALIARFLIEEGHDEAAEHVFKAAHNTGVVPTDLSTLTQAHLSMHLGGVFSQLMHQPPPEDNGLRGMLDAGSTLDDLLSASAAQQQAAAEVAAAMGPVPAPNMDIVPMAVHAVVPTGLDAMPPPAQYHMLPSMQDPGPGPPSAGAQGLASASATPYQPMSPLPELPAPSPELNAPQDLNRMSDTQQPGSEEPSEPDPAQPQEQRLTSQSSQPLALSSGGGAGPSLHQQQQQQQQQPQQPAQSVSAPARQAGTFSSMELPTVATAHRANSTATGGSLHSGGAPAAAVCEGMPVGQGVGVHAVDTAGALAAGGSGFARPIPTSPNHSHGMQHSISMQGMGQHASGGGSGMAGDVALMARQHPTSSVEAPSVVLAPPPQPQHPAVSLHTAQELDMAPHMMDAHLASIQPHHVLRAPLETIATAAVAALEAQVQAISRQFMEQVSSMGSVSATMQHAHHHHHHSGVMHHAMHQPVPHHVPQPQHHQTMLELGMVPEITLHAGGMHGADMGPGVMHVAGMTGAGMHQSAVHGENMLQEQVADEGGTILDLIRDDDESEESDDLDELENSMVEHPVAPVEEPDGGRRHPGEEQHDQGASPQQEEAADAGDLHLLPLDTQRSGLEEGVVEAVMAAAGLGRRGEGGEREGGLLRRRSLHPDALGSPADLMAAGVLTPGLDYGTPSLEDEEMDGGDGVGEEAGSEHGEHPQEDEDGHGNVSGSGQQGWEVGSGSLAGSSGAADDEQGSLVSGAGGDSPGPDDDAHSGSQQDAGHDEGQAGEGDEATEGGDVRPPRRSFTGDGVDVGCRAESPRPVANDGSPPLQNGWLPLDTGQPGKHHGHRRRRSQGSPGDGHRAEANMHGRSGAHDRARGAAGEPCRLHDYPRHGREDGRGWERGRADPRDGRVPRHLEHARTWNDLPAGQREDLGDDRRHKQLHHGLKGSPGLHEGAGSRRGSPTERAGRDGRGHKRSRDASPERGPSRPHDRRLASDDGSGSRAQSAERERDGREPWGHRGDGPSGRQHKPSRLSDQGRSQLPLRASPGMPARRSAEPEVRGDRDARHPVDRVAGRDSHSPVPVTLPLPPPPPSLPLPPPRPDSPVQFSPPPAPVAFDAVHAAVPLLGPPRPPIFMPTRTAGTINRRAEEPYHQSSALPTDPRLGHAGGGGLRSHGSGGLLPRHVPEPGGRGRHSDPGRGGGHMQGRDEHVGPWSDSRGPGYRLLDRPPERLGARNSREFDRQELWNQERGYDRNAEVHAGRERDRVGERARSGWDRAPPGGAGSRPGLPRSADAGRRDGDREHKRPRM